MLAPSVETPNTDRTSPPQIIVLTSAMLVFISYWRAAAVVLCDMASTVYYIGGIVEHAVGKAAPWYIGGVMLFAYVVRGVRARRRVPRGEGSNGRHTRQTVSLRAHVRLRAYRPDQRRVGRPVHRGVDERAVESRACSVCAAGRCRILRHRHRHH